MLEREGFNKIWMIQSGLYSNTKSTVAFSRLASLTRFSLLDKLNIGEMWGETDTAVFVLQVNPMFSLWKFQILQKVSRYIDERHNTELMEDFAWDQKRCALYAWRIQGNLVVYIQFGDHQIQFRWSRSKAMIKLAFFSWLKTSWKLPPAYLKSFQFRI